METFPQLLNRLAHQHFERTTLEYIQQLEAVAKAARVVTDSNDDFNAFKGAEQLKQALSGLSPTELKSTKV